MKREKDKIGKPRKEKTRGDTDGKNEWGKE